VNTLELLSLYEDKQLLNTNKIYIFGIDPAALDVYSSQGIR